MAIVTKEEYLLDLANTQIEARANRDIASGFRTLAALPENAGTMRRKYLFQADVFETRAKNCDSFLEKLKTLDKSMLV